MVLRLRLASDLALGQGPGNVLCLQNTRMGVCVCVCAVQLGKHLDLGERSFE